MVYWITGLAGSGKTTVGEELTQRLRERGRKVIHLDGDQMREVLGANQGGDYSPQARQQLSMTYARLCQLLDLQGVDVVCSTISMFHETRRWNRQSIEDYFEVYLKVTPEVLAQRNQKDLYSGSAQNVVGKTLEFEEPLEPNLCIENQGAVTPALVAQEIIELADV